jgi:hypothetical protein
MQSLGARGGAAGRNSGDLAGGLGRGVAGEELGVARARFGCLLAAGRRPEGVAGGAGRRAPLELGLRLTCRSVWPTSGCGG